MSGIYILLLFVLFLFFLVWKHVAQNKQTRQNLKKESPHLFLTQDNFFVDDVQQAIDSVSQDTDSESQ